MLGQYQKVIGHFDKPSHLISSSPPIAHTVEDKSNDNYYKKTYNPNDSPFHNISAPISGSGKATNSIMIRCVDCMLNLAETCASVLILRKPQ